MSGQDWNIESAKGAVDYVKRTLPMGAGNQWQDVAASSGRSRTCVDQLRASYLDSINFGHQDAAWVRSLALRARHAGCGNCAEQCALAITWLWEYSLAPIDFMGFIIGSFDHQFVVIGRDPSSEVNDIASWGPAAAICDPWSAQPISNAFQQISYAEMRAYPASFGKARMNYLAAAEPSLMLLNRWDRRP